MTDIGGIGTLIYHTFRFKDYEYDYLPDDTLVLKPLVYKGYEPDIDKDRSLNGSDLFVALYNLAERINDFSEEKSFDELIIELCRTVAHPYDIDTVYLALTEDGLDVEREGKWISEEASFPVDDFKRDIERFYHGAKLYFTLRQIADGDDCDYLSLSEDGRHFDGIYGFDKFGAPVMPETEQEAAEDYFDPTASDDWEKIFAEADAYQKKYEQFLEEHEHDKWRFTLDPIYEFYELRNKLLEMIPDFQMRLKVDPKTDKVVFAASVRSIFDIAWFTLARYMVDVQLTDEGTIERYYPNAKVCVCKCCGKAFARPAEQNRRQYCGDPDCDLKRVRERMKCMREKAKIKEQQEKKA